MGLSKNITLTIKDYEIRLDKQIKFYENDTIDLCFSILEYGIEVKNGVSINKLMPIQALTAYMLIETPQGVDYAESTKIENNKIVFNLGAKYSQFVGIGHMQIVIKDSDGCRVTLPEFEFEIKKSINSDWEREVYFLSTEDDSIIIDEFGRKIHMSKISDMPESENLSEESYAMIIDEEGNKRFKVRAIADAVEDSLDTKFNAYTDEINGDVERIKGEVNEIGESLDNLEGEVNKLKEGNIDIDLTDYATKSELSTKADKTELHSHTNKNVLDGISSAKVTEWNNKSTFSGNYNDLTNKPTIPSKTSQLNNDSGFITSIPSEYVTEVELSSKGYLTQHQSLEGLATEEYVKNKIAEAQLEGEDIDLSGYAVKSDLEKKVDKVEGKSLISDSEIVRLATVKNYDDTEIRNTLNNKANASELHSHTNKSVLDNITSSKVNEWNNKSTFDGNYNNLTNKPTIPTKVSELTNDSGYLTTHQDISGKADKTELHSHSNKNVLDGITSNKITEWDNKSNFSGNYNDLTNKPTIPTKTSQLTNDSSFITSIPNEYVTETELTSKGYLTSHQDISGKADKSTLTAHTSDTTSHITATERNTWNAKSNLALGTTSSTAYRGDYGNTAYTHSQTAHAPSNAQKNSDITKAEIEARLSGNISSHTHSQYLTTHQSLANYPKTSELTLGVHTDGLIYLFKNGEPIGSGVAQSTTILPDGDVVGYVDSRNNIVLNGSLPIGLYTVKYEMDDGTLIDVGIIDKTTTDVGYTNVIEIVGYTNNARISTSTGETKTDGATGYTTTGFIEVKEGDIIRTSGIDMRKSTNQYCSYAIFDSSKTKTGTGYLDAVSNSAFTTSFDSKGNLTLYCGAGFDAVKSYLRLCGFGDGANLIVTVNQVIKGNEPSGSYTNLVATSIDTDGTLFNGVGYKDGYRSNSSGGLTALSGCTVTGLIPFNPSTDTVRVKGVNRSSSIPTSDYANVAIYDANKKFICFASPSGHQNVGFTWTDNPYGYVDEDGSYVIYTPTLTDCYIQTLYDEIKNQIAYIRICGQGSGSEMIVTINERIQ